MCCSFVLLEQRVVDRQHRAARIAEDVLDALIGERLDHHFRAGHFPAGAPAPVFVIVRSIPHFSYSRPRELKRGR